MANKMESLNPMRSVWSIADSIVSPLGFTSAENYASIRKGISGIKSISNQGWYDNSFFASSIETIPKRNTLTRFEWMCSEALENALSQINPPSDRTLFILSTTKGNITLLEDDKKDEQRILLPATAKYLSEKYVFKNHLVVSNACISGVLALIVAKRFIEGGQYDHAVVLGADVVSKFVVSGFQSLNALSAEPCKPFDANRSGINLGEAAAVMILSTNRDVAKGKPCFRLCGTGVSNDANHISGPSRTGEELAQAIQQALQTSNLTASDIDFLSAHGTATLYNDEMEAKAFDLAGMNTVPVNSVKGYFGHTLGAAGILETIISMHSMMANEVIPTKGFITSGVSKDLNLSYAIQSKPLNKILKTASGFGGCNAAIVIEKEN